MGKYSKTNNMAIKKESKLTHWMAEHGIALLRISIGIIFLWFGCIKYFPGLSSMEALSLRTIKTLTFGLFSNRATAIGLASLECLIGIGLVTGKFLRVTLLLLLLQGLISKFCKIVLILPINI